MNELKIEDCQLQIGNWADGNGQFGGLEIFRGQVNLGLAAVDEANVHHDEVVEAGEGAVAEAVPSLLGAGEGDPDVALSLGKGAPTGGDGGEDEAHNNLSGSAGVKRNEGGIADLAVPIALKDESCDFAGFDAGHN